MNYVTFWYEVTLELAHDVIIWICILSISKSEQFEYVLSLQTHSV